jgi:hypothetical protein
MLGVRHLGVIVGLLQTYVLNQPTMYSTITDGPARFRRCCDFLKEHGTFPRPVVLENIGSRLDVLDGHHRLTAFFFLYGYFKVEHPDVGWPTVQAEQDVWVASPH